MADTKCGFCRKNNEVEDVCGRLRMASTSRGEVAAHHKCMQYSSNLSQYKIKTFGGFKVHKVLDEIGRGKQMKCSICKARFGKKAKNISGATAGCAIPKCRKTFHFYCAKTDNDAVAKRMEISEETGKKHVEYRVFCGLLHQRLYERTSKDVIQYVSHSEEDSDDNNPHADADQSPHSYSADFKPKITQDFESESSSSDDEPPAKRARQSTSEEDSCRPATKQRSTSTSSDSGNEGKPSSTKQHTTGNVAPSSSTHMNSGKGDTGGNQKQQGSSHQTYCSTSHVVNNKRTTRTIGSLVPVHITADVSSFYENNNIASTCHGQDHVVCIITSHGNGGNSADVNMFLQTRVKELYGVDAQFVHTYVFQTWSSVQALTYVKDLSQALRAGNFREVKDLMSTHPEKCAPPATERDQRESSQSPQEFEREMQLDIQSNFVVAKETYNVEVGRFCREKNCNKLCVAYVHVCDAVDPYLDIRASLVKPNRLYKWGQTTSLQQIEGVSPEAQTLFEICEFKALLKWLQKELPTFSFPPTRYPQDHLLFPKVIHPHSVCEKLYQECSRENANGRSSNSGKMVFIGPLDQTIVDHRSYIHKCLEHLVQKELVSHCRLFCVFEVGVVLGIKSVMDMVQPVPGNNTVKVWSGLDPETCPVSCVVLELARPV